MNYFKFQFKPEPVSSIIIIVAICDVGLMYKKIVKLVEYQILTESTQHTNGGKQM